MWRGAEQEECLMVGQHAIPPGLFPLFSPLPLSLSLCAGLHVRNALLLLRLLQPPAVAPRPPVFTQLL